MPLDEKDGREDLESHPRTIRYNVDIPSAPLRATSSVRDRSPCRFYNLHRWMLFVLLRNKHGENGGEGRNDRKHQALDG